MQRSTVLRARHLGFLALLLVVAASTGCTKVGKVTGKVMYGAGPYGDEAPLGAGTIYIVKEGAKNANEGDSAEIQPDGTYTINKAPLGPCKVYLDTASVLQAGGGGGPHMQGGMPGVGGQKVDTSKFEGSGPDDKGAERQKAYRELPPGYNDMEKTTLKLDVKKGSQVFDFTIEPPKGWTPKKNNNMNPGGIPGK